jgi:hypothetical protein
MKRRANVITLDNLNKFLYVEGSILKWKYSTSKRCKLNQEAGSFKNNGYKKVGILGKTYLVHRILFQMYNSLETLDPEIIIDHVDGNILNNSASNLRMATDLTSTYNTKSSSRSGYKGVSDRKHTRKYMARIGHTGKEMFLGYYDTKEEAAKAYDNEAIKIQGGFAKLNFPVD